MVVYISKYVNVNIYVNLHICIFEPREVILYPQPLYHFLFIIIHIINIVTYDTVYEYRYTV